MKRVFNLMAAVLLTAACTTDSYDKGEDTYSLMQADFVEVSTNADLQVTSFVTDDGLHYTLTAPATASWLSTPDSTYRVILYYNKVSESTAEPVALGYVPTLRPREWWRIDGDIPEDPVGFESSWVSKSRRYLNLGILLRTGQVDGEDGIHTIGLVQDTIMVNDNHTRTAYYRFIHDQSGVPEYYTNRRYVSLFIPQTDNLDSIRLHIPTYDGSLEKIYPLK